MIAIAIKIYIVFAIVMFFGITFEAHGDIFSFAVTPNEIRRTSNLNILGSILFSILLFIFNPFLFVFRFIHFIFHVKRD